MSGTSSLWLFAIAVCLMYHSVTSAPSLGCAHTIPNGEYFGRITGIIDKDGWWNNYLFKPNGEEVGCVQLNAPEHLEREKLLLTAYLTNALVKLSVIGNHEIRGIAFGN